jgi:hypothetical protein
MDREGRVRLKRLHKLVESVCGLYSRVARQLRVSPSFVSRVARGERRSEPVEAALLKQLSQIPELSQENHVPGKI